MFDTKSQRPEDVVLNIYTDLDSLLDTRLSVAQELAFIQTGEYVKQGKYFKRTHDQIGIIPQDVFKLYYSERHKHHLGNAMPTYIVQLVTEDYMRSLLESEKLLGRNDLTLYINIWPYELEDEELTNLKGMFANDTTLFNIVYMNVPNHKLNADWVAKNINSMYKYDLLEWFEIQTYKGKVGPTTLLNLSAYFPLIHNSEIKYNDSVNEVLQETLKYVMQAYPLQAKMFSAIFTDLEVDKTVQDLTTDDELDDGMPDVIPDPPEEEQEQNNKGNE